MTNSVRFLTKVDEIILFENGYVCDVGSFSDLIQHSPKFIKFMKPFLQEEVDLMNSRKSIEILEIVPVIIVLQLRLIAENLDPEKLAALCEILK